jgi:alcohol dehydrogenase (cytochrome c)
MRTSFRRPVLCGIALSLSLMGTAAWVQAEDAQKGVTDVMLGADPGESWLHTNGNYAAQRYSTLAQLNPSSAANMRVAWIFSPGGKTDAQATPLFHDGMVFFPQDNKVFAIDASTGKLVWKYEHKLPEDWGGYNVPFFTGKHRGVAIYGENIYFLSNDAKLHAINYKTGQKKFVKDYSGDGFPYPKDFAKSKESNGYCTTIGPMAIAGTILVPMNATDTGGLPGYVLGVKPEDGALKWKANMIPAKGEPGADSWPGESAKYGGAGPWITGSFDPELKLYFTGTANAYEWNPKNRGGGKLDNTGAASVVAVNTDNGKVAWRYVTVPGDPWDFDVPQTPILIKMDGKTTIAHPNKTGYIHYLDPKTGKYLKADLFIDKINWVKGYDNNGRPQEMIGLPKEGGPAVEVWPSLLGGVNMYPNAYNPQTGLLYLAATNAGMKYGFEEIKVISNVRHFGAYQEFIWGYEVNQAWNPKTGKEVWRDQKAKPGYAGGMLTTAGNLTFYTTQGGVFQAVNATNGQIVYSLPLGTTAKAGPITFMHGGKQMVVQAVGGTPGFGRDETHGLEFGNMVVGFIAN